MMPILAFSTFMIVREALVQRDRLIEQIRAATLAASQAVDIEVERLQAIADTLAHSPMLNQRDFADFYALAKAAVHQQEGIRIVLYEASGQAILATNLPFEGLSMPRSGMQEVIQHVATTMRPEVSSLFIGGRTETLSLAVLVPVTEDGQATFVVGAVFPPAYVAEIFKRQLVPRGGRGVLADRNDLIITRSVEEARFAGHPVSVGTGTAISESNGIYDTLTLDGVWVRAVLVKSPLTGWSASYGIEMTALNQPLWRALWQFGGGALLCIAAALALAMRHSRRVAGPVLALGRMARALAHGEPIPDQHLGFVEAQVTADAIRDAAAELRDRAAERERTTEMMRRDRDLLTYYAIGSAAERSLDLEQRLQACLEAAAHALGMAAGSIHLVTPSDRYLRLGAAHGLSESSLHELETMQPGEAFGGAVSAEKSVVVVHPESNSTPRLQVFAESEGIKTLVGVPLLASGQMVGLLTLGTRVVRTFQPDERLLLGAIGHQLGAYIDHARLYETALNEIAERKKVQQQLEIAHYDLESFSYSVSHDLRAPLRAIEGFSRALLEDYGDKLDVEGRRLGNVICDSAERMTQMINDILAFARVGRASMEVAPVDMQALAQSAMSDLAPAIAGRQINFDVDQLPPARGDAAMLRQVWANLLGNAAKYTARRECAVIHVGGEVNDGKTIYFVRDNGVGFDMRYANKLFETFQRLHGSEFPGSGVGLSIVSRIVTRHGGSVWAEAEIEKGATFFFTLGSVNSEHPAGLALDRAH